MADNEEQPTPPPVKKMSLVKLLELATGVANDPNVERGHRNTARLVAWLAARNIDLLKKVVELDKAVAELATIVGHLTAQEPTGQPAPKRPSAAAPAGGGGSAGEGEAEAEGPSDEEMVDAAEAWAQEEAKNAQRGNGQQKPPAPPAPAPPTPIRPPQEP